MTDISKMTDDEIDKALALEVMEYVIVRECETFKEKKEGEWENSPCQDLVYASKYEVSGATPWMSGLRHEYYVECHYEDAYWNPTKSHDQVQMCIEKLAFDHDMGLYAIAIPMLRTIAHDSEWPDLIMMTPRQKAEACLMTWRAQ